MILVDNSFRFWWIHYWKSPNLIRKMHPLFRHSGMDRRNPDCRDATNPYHPWSLGSGDPCRNDVVLSLASCIKSVKDLHFPWVVGHANRTSNQAGELYPPTSLSRYSTND